MSTTSTASPTYFTGVSTYASDLQQVITRAVSIASMPLQLMQNQLQNLDGRQSAVKWPGINIFDAAERHRGDRHRARAKLLLALPRLPAPSALRSVRERWKAPIRSM